MSKLPDWFDWKKYESYIGNRDFGFWAHEFYIRSPDYEKDKAAGLTTVYTKGPTVNTVKAKMLWANGILSYGSNGHQTRAQMEHFVKQYAFIGNAVFVPESEFQALQKEKKLPANSPLYTVVCARIVGGESGWLKFNTQPDCDEFKNKCSALFDGTVSLTFNIDLPQDELVKQFKEVIKKHKQRRHKYKEINRKKITEGTTMTWAKGLACWDLIDRGCDLPAIADELVSILPKDNRGRKPAASDEGVVSNEHNDNISRLRRFIGAVEKQVEGGWKQLTGDPSINN